MAQMVIIKIIDIMITAAVSWLAGLSVIARPAGPGWTSRTRTPRWSTRRPRPRTGRLAEVAIMTAAIIIKITIITVTNAVILNAGRSTSARPADAG